MLVTKVQKWGNSQGLRLAKDILELAGIEVGEEVQLVVSESQIVVKRLHRPRFTLEELVSRIPKNYHAEEVNFGAPVGKEAW